MSLRFSVIFSCFLLICGHLCASDQGSGRDITSIPPFTWADTPDVILSHLSDLNAEFVDGSNTGDPIEAKNVPFMGYLSTIRAEFSGFYLKSVTFRIEASGPQEGLFFMYNDIDNQLKNIYGSPLSVNLLSRERVWRSSDKNRALWYQMVLQKIPAEEVEGTLKGSIALRGTTTGEGRQASNHAVLDVSGVKFTLNTTESINYKMILQITFQNLAPGQFSSDNIQAADDQEENSVSESDETSENDEEPEQEQNTAEEEIEEEETAEEESPQNDEETDI